MMMTLNLLTPDKQHNLTEVESLTAVTSDGEIGILSGHIALLTPVTVSMLTVHQARKRVQTFAIMGGLLHTDGQTLTVLCDAADAAQDIDALRAEEARKRAEARLKAAKADGVNIDRAQLALVRAMTRIKTVSTWVKAKN
jgi:F-type H+-transporting ATPase subunit epsilon